MKQIAARPVIVDADVDVASLKGGDPAELIVPTGPQVRQIEIAQMRDPIFNGEASEAHLCEHAFQLFYERSCCHRKHATSSRCEQQSCLQQRWID